MVVTISANVSSQVAEAIRREIAESEVIRSVFGMSAEGEDSNVLKGSRAHVMIVEDSEPVSQDQGWIVSLSALDRLYSLHIFHQATLLLERHGVMRVDLELDADEADPRTISILAQLLDVQSGKDKTVSDMLYGASLQECLRLSSLLQRLYAVVMPLCGQANEKVKAGLTDWTAPGDTAIRAMLFYPIISLFLNSREN